MTSIMQVVDKFIESDGGCRTDYFPWLLLDANARVLASGGSLERLLKMGAFSMTGNIVHFGYQQHELMAMLRHMRQEYQMYGTAKRCFLLQTQNLLPIIAVVNLIQGVKLNDVAGLKPDAEVHLINFIAENCCAIDVSVFKRLFFLTRAEARVLAMVCEGHSLDEIAEMLDCKVGSVRFHVKNIFQKTGVKKQSELVSLVLSLIFALGKTPDVCTE